MPILQAKTISSKEIWRTPDGQRIIWELQLEAEGSQVTAKTYSKAIAEAGWSGEVETYEKQGSKGSETFVRQAPKEDGAFQPRSQSSQPSGGSKSTYIPKDEKAIQAMWSIGQAIQYAQGKDVELDTLESLAIDLFAMVATVKASGEEAQEVVDDKEELKKALDRAFGTDEEQTSIPVEEGEKPWNPANK
jgi:hypothetical protein